MSFLRSIGKILNVVKDVGLPILGTALGGPAGGIAAGALAGAVGHGKPKVGNIGMGAASGALAGFGGSLLGGAGKAASLGSGAFDVGGGALTNAVTSAGTKGLLSSIGSGLLHNAPLILGGIGAVQSAKQGAAASKLEDEALAIARARDAEMAPLRTAGMTAALDRFQHPVTPYDAVGGYVDAGNPYSHALAGAPGAVPLPVPVVPPALGGVTPLRRAKPRGAR